MTRWDIVDAIPGLERGVLERRPVARPCVIDQHVQPAEATNRLFHGTLPALLPSHGEFDESRPPSAPRNASRHLLPRLGLDVCDHNRSPFLREQGRLSSAHTSGCTRNQRYLALEPHHFSSPRAHPAGEHPIRFAKPGPSRLET